ncbi:MAG: hypothetical protein IJR49_01440, partial [Treponema sp.]|nr:hypothetical protein [Treponema sp.]
MLKKLSLLESDLHEIKNAVEKAERSTSGEIRIALTAESAHYSFWELLAAVCVGAFVCAVLVPLSGFANSMLARFFWVQRIWEVPAYTGLISFACIIIAFYVFNIPFFDRLVVPRRVMRKCVKNRAFRFF